MKWVRATITDPFSPSQAHNACAQPWIERPWSKGFPLRCARDKTHHHSMTDDPDERRSHDPAELYDLVEEALEEDLEPLSPEEALEEYLEDKRRDCREQTVITHKDRLKWFLQYCEEEGITNLNDLSIRDLRDFRNWRLETGDLNTVSDQASQMTLRVFIRWAERLQAVQTGLAERIEVPVLGKGEDAREETISPDRADNIIRYLDTYEYASRYHVTWKLLKTTGMRTGGARGIDLKDYCPEAEVPHLKLRHRPETGTPLKNGGESERCMAISGKLREILDAYIRANRPDVVDDEGRQPLIATQHGRIAASSIARDIYRWSRPCQLPQDCPHDREQDDCEAQQQANNASKCPSTKSPHPLRRMYISRLLREGVSVNVVSNRCDVTKRILHIHYDERSPEEKMRLRKQQMDAVLTADNEVDPS